MKVIRLPRAKVQLGAPLPWNVRDEHGVLLLSCGHVVTSEHQLEALLQRGAFVDVEEVRATATESRPVAADPASGRSENLFDLWQHSAQGLHALVAHPATVPHWVQAIGDFAQTLVALLGRSPDIAIYCCVRQDHAKPFYYGYAHAVQTGLLCVLLARHLGWTAQRTLSLLSAALTMNLTIHDLQGQMASQDVPMKDKQRAAIQAHPHLAVQQLRALGVNDEDWLGAIAQHHERADGSGYPEGLHSVGEMAVALRVADVFMAKISPRLIRPALSVQDAARQLYREDNGGALSTALIKELGIYPPGDFVALANGELAVVVERTGNVRAPVVAAITDSHGRPVVQTTRRDTSVSAWAITRVLSDKTLLARLPPERLYGYAQAGS